MDLFKAHAKGLAGGLEADLSVVIDVMFPMAIVTAAVTAFHANFPITPLRLYVESLGAVIQPILDGRCALGVLGALPLLPPQFSQERLLPVRIVHVAAPKHPLAAYGGIIATAELAKHVQLVLTDRSTLSEGRDLGVLSLRTWRLADLGAKHAFLRAGLGWGGMPIELVRSEIARGLLVEISAEGTPPGGFVLPMSAVYRTEAPPGPAGRWFINCLKQHSDVPVARRATADLPMIAIVALNDLLDALSSGDYERVASHLELLPMNLGDVLYESGAQLRHVYFPTTSIISRLSLLTDNHGAL
jgi:DNA-binding transcriptional LysR family regulator